MVKFRLVSSDLSTDCVNTVCRIEVMTCSFRVKIMQINAADKLARARLFIHYFARTEISKRKDKTRRSVAYSAEAFWQRNVLKSLL